MEKYRIRNGVFQGVIITREAHAEIKNVCLLNQENGKPLTGASAFAMGEKGQCQFLAKLSNPAYPDGRYSILVQTNSDEYLVDFPVPQSEREFGKTLSMSQTEIIPEQELHLIPAVGKTGFFELRKCKTEDSYIHKSPAYISAIKEGEDSLTLSCKTWLDKNVRQAELLFWCEETNEIMRIPMDATDLSQGTVALGLSSFIHEKVTDDEINKEWKLFFYANVEGDTYMSPLEHFKNKKAALNQSTYRTKTYDETMYYFGPFESEFDTRKYKKGTVVWSSYYDRQGQLKIKSVVRSQYYLDQYREKVENIRIEQGNCTVTVLCAESEFEYEALVLRSVLDPENEDRTYHFEKMSEKQTDEGTIVVWRRNLKDVEFEKNTMDFLLYAKKDGYHYEIRPTNLTNARKFTHPKMDNFYINAEGWFVFPVLDENENVVLYCRMQDDYDGRFIRFKEWVAECIFRVLRNYFLHRNVTLFCEEFCQTAQDNAYYMYDYLMNEKEVPEQVKRELYYIIDKKQPDYERVKKYRFHVLNYMSIRHMVYLLGVKQFISSETKEHAFHWQARPCQIVDHMKETPLLFLQHGVMGLKNVTDIYSKELPQAADLVIASSVQEKERIIEELGYSEDEIAMTGLARWDVLRDHRAGMRNILMMPTDRKWLDEVDDDTFAKSEFCRYYRELLQSQMLSEVLEAKGMTLIFCLHPKMKRFMHHFEVPTERVKLHDYEERTINELIMMCSLFVTDYSSAAWDAYYLGKPVVFYQFDEERFQREQGSYMNFEKELFGDRVTGPKELFQAILTYEYNDFRERPEHIVKRDEYLPLHENNHRQQIYEALKPWLVDFDL